MRTFLTTIPSVYMSALLPSPNSRHQPLRMPPTEGSQSEAKARSDPVRRAQEVRWTFEG